MRSCSTRSVDGEAAALAASAEEEARSEEMEAQEALRARK
jgi:hypothetical protein